MSRTKKVPFVDALDIWLETATEDEIMMTALQLRVWAATRRFKFRIKVEMIPQAEVVDAATKGGK